MAARGTGTPVEGHASKQQTQAVSPLLQGHRDVPRMGDTLLQGKRTGALPGCGHRQHSTRRTCHGHLQHLHLTAADCCCGLAAACREQPARVLGAGADCLGGSLPCPLHARGCCCWQGLAVCSPQGQGGNATGCLASTGQRQGGCHGGCLHLHGWSRRQKQTRKEGGSGSPNRTSAGRACDW